MQYFVGSLIQFYAQLRIEKIEILKLCYLKVVTNEKGEAVGEVVTIIC
jgi:hypothetical protein